MRQPLSFIILSLCFVALTVMAIVGDIPYWAWFLPVGTGIFATLIIFRGIWLPHAIVVRGMELIQSQDYNNRLVKVGEPTSDRIVSLFNSLIDKLRAERLQTKEQESLLQLLIEASPLGVVMLDFDNRISMTNRAFLKIFGIKSQDSISGRMLSELENDLVPEMTKVPLGNAEIIRKGNLHIYRIYHLNFIQEGFKREFFLIESLEEEIRKAEKIAYEKVIRTISHEVNNSMGGVRSVLEIIAETTTDEEIKRVVESCEHRCESMGNFIREYADVVKLPEPNLQMIELGKELDGIFPFLQRMIPGNIELIYNKREDDFFIKADSGLLQQVILNIVKNAVESIREKGVIEINVTGDEREVVLTISNNGAPIDQSISNQLFTPFFTTKPNGKGIGLTLVRDVLSRHSAEYSLSTGTDGITRFVISFPA
ncbi:MAG: PAS domain-containing sensor histidine kinase [Muribaculaceae bacterium]|nr:PAS domain-containing sensor histidine kinase [Muribaculaceae bacterium]